MIFKKLGLAWRMHLENLTMTRKIHLENLTMAGKMHLENLTMAGKMHLENLTIAGKMQLVGWKMQLKNLIMARKMQMGKVMHTVAWKLYLKKKKFHGLEKSLVGLSGLVRNRCTLQFILKSITLFKIISLWLFSSASVDI